MNGRIASGTSRVGQSFGTRRGGFTLVELLVVIAIIAMLMGLLIPAVQMAREAGRRATCMNNQQQIGKAVMNFATARDRFPSGFTEQPPRMMPPATSRYSIGWVWEMLPYIEQKAMYDGFTAKFQTNTMAVWMKPDGTVIDGRIAVLICPSRNATGSPAPLSYVVNAGMTDNYTPDAGTPLDWQTNGIFFDHFTPLLDPSKGRVTTDISYLTMHDGNAMTLLLSENVDALDWIALPPPDLAPLSPYAPPQIVASVVAGYSQTWWQGITWYLPTQPPPPPAIYNPPLLIRSNVGTGPPPAMSQDVAWAYPSSSHPGGFLATMCDGHTVFFSKDMDYRVYALLMCPDNQNAKFPGKNTTIAYPTSWTPLTATDLEN